MLVQTGQAQDTIFLTERHDLQLLQLHGDETPEYCQQLYEKGYSIAKAINLKDKTDLQLLHRYKPWVDYFLFDTPGAKYGGTGKTFNWSLLKEYDNQVPVFLSGGISLDNIGGVANLSDLNLYAIDVNSRFEVAPGLKNTEMLKELKLQLQQL